MKCIVVASTLSILSACDSWETDDARRPSVIGAPVAEAVELTAAERMATATDYVSDFGEMPSAPAASADDPGVDAKLVSYDFESLREQMLAKWPLKTATASSASRDAVVVEPRIEQATHCRPAPSLMDPLGFTDAPIEFVSTSDLSDVPPVERAAALPESDLEEGLEPDREEK